MNQEITRGDLRGFYLRHSLERTFWLALMLLVGHLLGFGHHSAFAFAVIGDAATITPTTSASSLNKVWRKIQGKLVKGFRARNPEWKWLKDVPMYNDIDYSAREMLVPVDLNRQGGAAHIPEGGYEANPQTVNVEEITVTWTVLSQRFSATLTAKRLDASSKGRQGQVTRQFKYQAVKAMESVSRRVSEAFYGYRTGVVAKTSTDATQASGTYTLIDAYSESGLDGAAYIAGFFAVGDIVALVRADALVTNAIGTITAVTPATPSITVTWAGSVDSDAGDSVVFANNALAGLTHTLAANTDYNGWTPGLLDALKTDSVHGLATSSVPAWGPGYSATSGGRFSRLKFRKMRQGIRNHGGGEMNLLILTEGVENDWLQGQEAAARFSDTKSFSLDLARSSDFKVRVSDRVPPGHAIGLDSRNSFHRFLGMDMPDGDGDGDDGGVGWEDGHKMENQNALLFGIDFEYGWVTTNRGNMAYESGLTEQ